MYSPFKVFQYFELLMVNIDYNKKYQRVIVNMFFWIEILFETVKGTQDHILAFLLFQDFKTLIL